MTDFLHYLADKDVTCSIRRIPKVTCFFITMASCIVLINRVQI